MSDRGPGPDPAAGDTGFTELRTSRLVLRRFRPDDAASLAGYRSDPDVARYQGWNAPFSGDQARAFVGALADGHPDTPGQWFQLAVDDGSGHIGDVGVFVDAADPRLARIGFTLARHAQGNGYATEAVTALLDYLFGERGKHRVTAECDARNHRSAALLERVGMRREAHHLAASWWKGEWTDEYAYALLAREWAARRRLRPLSDQHSAPAGEPLDQHGAPVDTWSGRHKR